MPTRSSSATKTLASIDAEIRQAEAERDRLQRHCKRFKIPTLDIQQKIDRHDPINLNGGLNFEPDVTRMRLAWTGTKEELASAKAWLAAWQAQRTLEDLELQRVLLQIEHWRTKPLPSQADINALSDRVAATKRKYEDLRGQLFRSREAGREHEARGNDLRRLLARARSELASTEDKVRDFQGVVKAHEQANRSALNAVEHAQEPIPPSGDALLFVRDSVAHQQ